MKSLTDSWNASTGATQYDQALTGYAGEGDMMSGMGALPDTPSYADNTNLFMQSAQNPGGLDTAIVDKVMSGVSTPQTPVEASDATWQGGIGSTALKVGGTMLAGYASQKAQKERDRRNHDARLKEIEKTAKLNRAAITPWR